MRPHDVRPRRRRDLTPQLEVPLLPAGTPVEHGQVDLVAPLPERQLELAHEHAEIGVGRPGVHLRDEEDPQRLAQNFSTPSPSAKTIAPIRTVPKGISAGAAEPPRYPLARCDIPPPPDSAPKMMITIPPMKKA